MQKRSLYSLLLTSFMLALAFSSLSAQTVIFEPKTVKRVDAQTIDITVENLDAISGFEIMFEVSETSTTGAVFDAFVVSWDGSFAVLQHRFIDYSGTGDCPGYTNGTLPGTVRLAGMMLDENDACLDPLQGGTTVAQVGFTSNNVCSGAILFDGTTCIIDKCNCVSLTIQTQFVDCATTAIVGASVTPGTVTIANYPVVMDPIPDAVIDWDKCFNYQTVVTDDDLNSVPGVPEVLTYSVVSDPPTTISITSGGKISWCPTPADMVAACEYEVTVEVEDLCNAVSTQVFMIYLSNDSPEFITCPTEVNENVWGYEASGSVSATDDDNGPVSLFYSVSPGCLLPGTVNLNSSTGDWTWQTEEELQYLGVFELCITVTDGAAIGCDPLYTNPVNSAECCVLINVISTGDAMMQPEYPSHTRQPAALLGQNIWVDFNMTNSTLWFGGFDFLIQYDQTAITLNGVEMGSWPTTCEWEYFQWRNGPYGNCGPNACDPGYLRVVAMAEINNGFTPPGLCFTGPPLGTWEMFRLRFLVTNDHTKACNRVPIYWKWYDCGDNSMSSADGETQYISRYVYDRYGNKIADADPLSLTGEYGLGVFEDYPTNTIPKEIWPTIHGALLECDVSGGIGKPFPVRLIDFWHGCIDIICVEDIDDRGDINMNGIVNEVADAVLFTRYFIDGIGVFVVGANAPAGQVAATDVNADGITLSVADLVYLIRAIVGDAAPYVKSAPVNVSYTHAESGIMSVDGAQIGAAFMVAEGNVMPDLKADAMEMKYNFDGANTRILVFSIEGNSFTGDFLDVKANILSIEMATAEGYPVKESLRPNNFALNQNYPNPFNPTTTLSFTLPTASDYMLTIYNVSGQTVAELNGSEQAGEVVLEWDAGNLASGIYFYKLQAGNFTDTKKMVLLK